ncbi:acyltransferase [Sphingobium sp. AN641]|uniref:acyltransferase family protein n=1 Tax=Sphingobium sp. AN641 TaxID=3133443 RepID=UPI0030C5F5C0
MIVPTPTDTVRRSGAIAIARVLCILGVVYVHAWTGLNGEALERLRGTPQETLRWVLMEAMGRSAVPLLGMLSGWLVAGSTRTRNWSDHVRRKARTVLAPMLIWNAIAILLVSGVAWAGLLAAPIPQSWGWLAQEMLILSRNPDINVQMPFLRDLFLCMVAAPLFVRLPSWTLLTVGAVAGAAHIFGLGPPLLMRASILCFFLIGMVARRTDLADRIVAVPLLLASLPYAVLMPTRLAIALHPGIAPQLGATVDLCARFAAALFMWRLAWALVPTRFGSLLRWFEPYAFFLFCAHLILIWLGGPLIGALTGPLGSPLYPLYLIAQPLLMLAAVVAIVQGLRRVAPALTDWLSGGRLGAADQAETRAASNAMAKLRLRASKS